MHICFNGSLFIQLHNIFLYDFTVLQANAFFVQRNGQHKNIFLFIGSVKRKRPFMQGCQWTCQWQSDTHPIFRHFSFFHLIERFKNILAHFLRNLVSITDYPNGKIRFILFQFYLYMFCSILQSIIEQITHNLSYCFFIYGCPYLFFQ